MFVVTEVSRVPPPFESQFRVVFQLIVLHFLKYQTACRFFWNYCMIDDQYSLVIDNDKIYHF